MNLNTQASRDSGILSAPQRHDMLFLKEEALAFARKAAVRLNEGLSQAEAGRLLTANIPAIVTRQPHRPQNGVWQVGFSFPMQKNGTRLRFLSQVPLRGAARHFNPFEAMPEDVSVLPEPTRAILRALLELGALCNLRVGLYGSLALQLLTGLPYLTPHSDYDIYLQPTVPHPALLLFYEEAQKLGVQHGVPLDMEIACPENSAAKLAEVLSGQKTVLCKGLYNVRLCPVAELGLF